MDGTRARGRPAQFALDDVVAAGRRIGMRDLSVQAVAAALDVTTAAVYRRVASRLDLERLVGEAVLADLDLPDDPGADAVGHLLRFAERLRAFTIANPGIGVYLQRSFPRGPSGARLLRAEVDALGRRGYRADAAMALAGAVAGIAIGLAVGEEARRTLRHAPGDADDELSALDASLAADDVLDGARVDLPNLDDAHYFRVVMTGAVAGLVDRLPPTTPVAALVAAVPPPTQEP